MLPVVSLLRSVASQGVDAHCCADYADGVVAFAESGRPKIVYCREGLSEPQLLAEEKDIECTALALSPDGAAVFAGGDDGTLLRIKLSDPNTFSEVHLVDEQGERNNHAVRCIAKDAVGNCAVAAGR